MRKRSWDTPAEGRIGDSSSGFPALVVGTRHSVRSPHPGSRVSAPTPGRAPHAARARVGCDPLAPGRLSWETSAPRLPGGRTGMSVSLRERWGRDDGGAGAVGRWSGSRRGRVDAHPPDPVRVR